MVGAAMSPVEGTIGSRLGIIFTRPRQALSVRLRAAAPFYLSQRDTRAVFVGAASAFAWGAAPGICGFGPFFASAFAVAKSAPPMTGFWRRGIVAMPPGQGILLRGFSAAAHHCENFLAAG